MVKLCLTNMVQLKPRALCQKLLLRAEFQKFLPLCINQNNPLGKQGLRQKRIDQPFQFFIRPVHRNDHIVYKHHFHSLSYKRKGSFTKTLFFSIYFT